MCSFPCIAACGRLEMGKYNVFYDRLLHREVRKYQAVRIPVIGGHASCSPYPNVRRRSQPGFAFRIGNDSGSAEPSFRLVCASLPSGAENVRVAGPELAGNRAFFTDIHCCGETVRRSFPV